MLLFFRVSETKQNNMKTSSDGHMDFSSVEGVSVVLHLPRQGYAVCGEHKVRMQTGRLWAA